MKGLFITFNDIYSSRKLLFYLAINDLKKKTAGSFFGIVWTFLQSFISIAVFIFVFQIGLKVTPINNVPFALWLSVGIIPWFYFSEGLSSATNSFIEYSYLVKKVVFKISIIPMIKIVSAVLVHLIFILLIILLAILYGYTPNPYYLQLLYYNFALTILLFGISFITSSTVIFFRDLNQIIGIMLQFGMWLTPIMWQDSMVPEKYRWIFKLNPMYYIVEGYRDAIINQVPFWQKCNQTAWFWLITIVIFIIGLICFKKLKPHFADVL